MRTDLNITRGTTTPIVWYDELAFAKYIRDTYFAAAPAQSQARASAIEKGVPYGTVITTTPNALSDPSGEFAFEIKSGALQFRLEFYDLGPKRVKKMIDEQAKFNFLYAEYQYYEIGRSKEWFDEQCRELLYDQMKIKRELLLVWPMSTEGGVFTEEQMDKVRPHELPVIASIPMKIRAPNVMIPAGLEMVFTKIPDPNKACILTIDTSGGVGVDYTAFTIIDKDDMKPVGTMRTNTADNDAVTAISKHLMTTLFPRSVAIIERNYLGIVLIDRLLKVPGLEPRIAYLVKEKEAERTIGKMVVKSKKKVRVYGIDTTADSREAMFRHLFQIVEELPHLLCSAAINGEIRTLVRTRTGKIQHRSGFHDDQLMSYLFAHYMDRHDQPILRQLLSRQQGSVKLNAGVANMNSLNVGADSISEVAHKASVPDEHGKSVLSVDDYVAPGISKESPNAARMAMLMSELNG